MNQILPEIPDESLARQLSHLAGGPDIVLYIYIFIYLCNNQHKSDVVEN